MVLFQRTTLLVVASKRLFSSFLKMRPATQTTARGRGWYHLQQQQLQQHRVGVPFLPSPPPSHPPYCWVFTSPMSMSSMSTSSSSLDDDFVVSILGPANAGKSTLFNRLQCKERNKSYRLGSDNKRTGRGGRGRNNGGGGRGRKGGIRGRMASRFLSRGDAIVSPQPGTTRDRRECWGRIGSCEFRLVDTAGVDGERIQTLNSVKGGGGGGGGGKKITTTTTTTTTTAGLVGDSRNNDDTNTMNEKKAMERAMMEQTLEAAKQSDLVLLMWDARVGITHDLHETVRWLRKLGKSSTSSTSSGSGDAAITANVAILANKLEGDAWVYDDSPVLDHLNEVQRLGMGEAIPISALQGDGMADIAILIERLKAEKYPNRNNNDDGDDENDKDNSGAQTLSLAICGRPNVGKSTLVNTLLQRDRVITGPMPYLTRDAIAVSWKWQETLVQLVDTAGIRKLTKRMEDTIEDMAVADTLRALKTAEVVVLVLDADAMHIQRQELAICNAVMEEGRALVIAANKMDLLEMSSDYGPQDYADAVREQIESRIPMLRMVPIVPMSGLTGDGVPKLLPAVLDARNRWERTISTGLLNRWLKEVAQGAPPPVVSGVRSKLKYIVQTKGRPPTFILFSNTESLPEHYLRYLTKQFQDSFELFGMPVRMIVQKSASSNPYHKPDQRKRSGFGLGGSDARMQRKIKQFKTKKTTRRKKANS